MLSQGTKRGYAYPSKSTANRTDPGDYEKSQYPDYIQVHRCLKDQYYKWFIELSKGDPQNGLLPPPGFEIPREPYTRELSEDTYQVIYGKADPVDIVRLWIRSVSDEYFSRSIPESRVEGINYISVDKQIRALEPDPQWLQECGNLLGNSQPTNDSPTC